MYVGIVYICVYAYMRICVLYVCIVREATPTYKVKGEKELAYIITVYYSPIQKICFRYYHIRA